MEPSTVVVIRLLTGEDVLAFFHGENDGIISVEHPHFVQVNSTLGTIALLPYCSLSDETFFELDIEQVNFIVLASGNIESMFVEAINDLVFSSSQERLDFEELLTRLEDGMYAKNYVKGTDVKH